MTELESGFRLADVLAMIRRRIFIVLTAAILGLLAGYLLLADAETVYSATAQVQVKPLPGTPTSGSSPTGTVNMPTEAGLVKSDSVIDAARQSLNLEDSNRAVRSRVAVTTEEQSLILKITFEGDTAAQTRDGANAVAEAYREQRGADAEAARQRELEQLNQRKAEAAQARAEATTALNATPPNSVERTNAQQLLDEATAALTAVNAKINELGGPIQPDDVADLRTKAELPAAITPKTALAKGVGAFGFILVLGLAIAAVLDRRDGLGGGRRRVEQLVPNATSRVLPSAQRKNPSAAEMDTAIDRMAVELVASSGPGRARGILVVGTGAEPPVALAEELASSLAFAGIPALFVLAGSTDRELRRARVVDSFADLLTSTSITGPAGLPEVAGAAETGAAPTVTWLRPRGSAESAGLLRRAVVDTLINRAGRERFEAVVFVAPSPERTASAVALGQWVERTAVIVDREERSTAEAVVSALVDADITVTEVVWA